MTLLKELLFEGKNRKWVVETDGDFNFSVEADTMSQARNVAKEQLRKNYNSTVKITKIYKDKMATKDIGVLRRQLQRMIVDSKILKNSPSLRKGYQRKLDNAETWSDLIKLKRKFERDLKITTEPGTKASELKEGDGSTNGTILDAFLKKWRPRVQALIGKLPVDLQDAAQAKAAKLESELIKSGITKETKDKYLQYVKYLKQKVQ